ncbi:L,D-transpeptidase [Ahrensia sp. R2A130]|uniref:L,D-transpeptidase n=1 Tax=Ahrensia sp. R2A130 TaxID=744979 RepID=UPI0001E0F070|nr:L,D-transpeptidase [Ahrensia sp. R2A130]EFL90426.1 ErfK/YbiS/YcfS/YnhG family protein [Ahrensia sp. R2A130]
MFLKMTALRATLTGLAVAVAASMMPAPAAYAAAERWYDISSMSWKEGRKPSKRRYMSDKSPIRKRMVRFDKQYSAGTIVIDTDERRLYFVTKRGRAMKYGVGVGRDGFEWNGTHKITRKAKWPSWTPPQEMIARVKREQGIKLKSFYKGGPKNKRVNPMGARGLYIGSTIYRIHGTNQPWTIGKAMSSGCIRMANDDVSDLYERAKVGAKVIVR